jgi:hypothetical protein
MPPPSRCLISLTTTPSRIRLIRPVLESLAEQSCVADAILLNVPHRSRRVGQEYVIPDWIAAFSSVHVRRCRDYGPATKLLGALEFENDPATLLITVDDDTCYPPFMTEALLNTWHEHGDHVYCSAGFNISEPNEFAQNIAGHLHGIRGHMRPVHVAEGYGGVLYRRGLFGDDIFDIEDMPDCVLFSDDLYISNYLSRAGVKKFTVETPCFGGIGFWNSRVLPFGYGEDALHRNASIGNNRTRYAQAVRCFLDAKSFYLLPV